MDDGAGAGESKLERTAFEKPGFDFNRKLIQQTFNMCKAKHTEQDLYGDLTMLLPFSNSLQRTVNAE
jgi:hypothetical protein